MDVVRGNFFRPNVEEILNIPLNPVGSEDSLAWALEKSDSTLLNQYIDL